jgi:hypothetical protein
LQENLQLAARIDEDQTASIFVRNRYMGEEYNKRIEINKLTFYYDLAGLPEEVAEDVF